jgi:hypothetical protein
MRARNPCLRARRRVLGWNVRFMGVLSKTPVPNGTRVMVGRRMRGDASSRYGCANCHRL